jgi:hypothetical protein
MMRLYREELDITNQPVHFPISRSSTAAAAARNNQYRVRHFLPIQRTTTANSNENGLTTRQIENHITQIPYTIGMTGDTRCPISLEDFRENDLISRINYCQHIFKTNHLTQWLTNHTQCPVCRYEMNDTDIEAINNNENEDERNRHQSPPSVSLENLGMEILMEFIQPMIHNRRT